MLPITEDYKPIIILITGVSFIFFLVTAYMVRSSIDYWIRRLIPQLHEKPPTHSTTKGILLGGFFWLFLASTIMGVVLSRPSAGTIQPNQFEGSFTLPTPESALANSGASAIRLEIDFPPGLEPCSVEALTLIPEEIDPYELPPIYPIDDWFERHEFVNRAYARISIMNTATQDEIQVANRIITRVTQRQELDEIQNAAYTICNEQTLTDLPQININPGGLVAGSKLGQEEYINLRPWDPEIFEVELTSQEPGMYEIEVGVEYLDGDQVVQVWSPETLHLYTPTSFHRWSAGVVTYWGLCNFEQGEYVCEELEYEEPVLLAEGTSQNAEGGQGLSSDATDPHNCRPAPTSRLSVGMEASVSYRLSLRLRIREAPGLASNVITAMNRGTEMTIVDGPVCQDGYLWWMIEKESEITGWSAEGEPWMYYLEPLG
jgi:hypothetical protein